MDIPLEIQSKLKHIYFAYRWLKIFHIKFLYIFTLGLGPQTPRHSTAFIYSTIFSLESIYLGFLYHVRSEPNHSFGTLKHKLFWCQLKPLLKAKRVRKKQLIKIKHKLLQCLFRDQPWNFLVVHALFSFYFIFCSARLGSALNIPCCSRIVIFLFWIKCVLCLF